MFVLYDAMQKRAILMINSFEYYPRRYIEDGYYFLTRPSTAGIIRVRVLFKGGSYMRKYGTFRLVWYQDSEIQFKLAIHIVYIMFSKSSGMIQHVFKFWQNIWNFSDYHGQCRGAPIGPGGNKITIVEFQAAT